MANLLVIESSPRSASSSSALVQEYVAQWQRKNPGGTIVRRDVFAEPIPFISEAWIGASFTPPEARTAEQKELLSLSDTLINELEAADTIVIGTPMHNFGISAPLKTWIDQIVRSGRTFAYLPEGPQGLLKNKKTVIAVSRGGAYSGDSPLAFLDQQEPYLRTALGFIGLQNPTFVYAENQSRGPEAAEAGLKSGLETILALA